MSPGSQQAPSCRSEAHTQPSAPGRRCSPAYPPSAQLSSRPAKGGRRGAWQFKMAHFGNYHTHCCDVIWRITEWQKNGEFLVFMEAEDSAEGLVKVATREKVYKCLEVR